MARAQKSQYVCQACGTTTTRWAGRCANCEEWNTLVEETAAVLEPGTGLQRSSVGKPSQIHSLGAENKESPRISTKCAELDRVMGGGLVPGSVVLIGGEPGIGKSTLLLQVASDVSRTGKHVLYFSGEEALSQVRLRAKRLSVADAPVGLVHETSLANILATLNEGPRADLIIIDSIQTLWSDGLEGAPGTISQVRAACQALIRHCKNSGTALYLVGHITKEGQIAGPKIIEHMVDTVLYFEGDRGHAFRILRSVKNRFGATDEIGVFEMANSGLAQVKNPSAMFLGDRKASSPGTSVFAGIEGTRPLLVELQALVAPSSLGTPRRAVIGWDANRLNMLLAVLDARCGISLAQYDVYLNVAGGLKIKDPAADLAAAAALLSSKTGNILPEEHVYFGEISLTGALRSTSHTPARLKEAQKLGFTRAIIPTAGEIEKPPKALQVNRLNDLKELANLIAPCQ